MSHLTDLLSRLFSWLIPFAEWAGQWLWHHIVGACVAVLSAVPVPGWLANAPSMVGAIPPGVAFFLVAFELPAGLVIIVSAWGIRFFLRHIPLIGG